MTLRNYIQISQRNRKKKGLLGMWEFSAKIQVPPAYTLENYSNFESNFSFNKLKANQKYIRGNTFKETHSNILVETHSNL